VDASGWDQRYADTPMVWSAGPNALFAELTADLPPGSALDVGCGEGRTALWLAGRGWQVTALDFSRVGVEKGRARAAADRLRVEWVVADVTTAVYPPARYDLVAILYLHLPGPAMTAVLTGCAGALAPGGSLVVIGHHRRNLAEGVGGPQDPAILHDPAELAAAVPKLTVARAEAVGRAVEDGTAIDSLLLAQRPGSPIG
jgi:2-polyprenyl-3-methyl-5-hydroxy-6-metoxy-1,4-benzoquinol methylase